MILSSEKEKVELAKEMFRGVLGKALREDKRKFWVSGLQLDRIVNLKKKSDRLVLINEIKKFQELKEVNK